MKFFQRLWKAIFSTTQGKRSLPQNFASVSGGILLNFHSGPGWAILRTRFSHPASWRQICAATLLQRHWQKQRSMGDFSAGFLSITNGRKLLYFSYSFMNLTPIGRTAPYRSRFCFNDGGHAAGKRHVFPILVGPKKTYTREGNSDFAPGFTQSERFCRGSFQALSGPYPSFCLARYAHVFGFFWCQISATRADFVSDPGNGDRFCVRSWQRGQILCQILATGTDFVSDPGNEDRFCVRS